MGFGVSMRNRKDAEQCTLYDAVLENKRKCRVCVHYVCVCVCVCVRERERERFYVVMGEITEVYKLKLG